MQHSTTTRTLAYVKTGILSVAIASFFAPYAIVPARADATAARSVSSPFLYTFNSDGTLDEAGSMSDSSSPYFWLNSGGVFQMKGGVGMTVQDNLASDNKWRLLYNRNNPLDTAAGFNPQNIFRFLTRNTWEDVVAEAKFKIVETNLTDTPNRDGYSGLLMMSRYKDSQNLYYAGIRQDGKAVIKKKKGGVYTTLGLSSAIYPGTYNKWSNPNLIPDNQWIGIRSETKTNSNGSVSVTLYIDKSNNGNWTKVLSVTDSSSPITGAGYAGMRTDYMDVQFENFKLTEL